MDTESGRERERESECESGLKYLWSTTSQGSAGLQHCPPGEQVDSVSVPAGPSWQPPDGSLVSITWMCTHTLTHSIYIYAVYILFTHTILQYCHFALQKSLSGFEFYKCLLIFLLYLSLVHNVMMTSARSSGLNGQRKSRLHPYLTWCSCTSQDDWCQR